MTPLGAPACRKPQDVPRLVFQFRNGRMIEPEREHVKNSSGERRAAGHGKVRKMRRQGPDMIHQRLRTGGA